MTLSEFKSLIDFIPSLNSKSVLEYGSESDSILANILKEQGVSKHTKTDSIQAESTKKFDYVVLNVDLSSLNDDSFSNLTEKVLNRLIPGGYLLYTASFASKQNTRSEINYIDLTQMKVESGENGIQYGFELVFAKPSGSNTSSTFNKVSYLFQKLKLENYHGFKTLKEFMDHKQYSRNGVIRYEKIFGAGFVSTGGIDTTTEFLKDLDLKPNQKVLDVGCGIGGGDFLMAEKYGVEVLGIDLASNMVGIAWERAEKLKNNKVQFEIGDITKQKYPNDYFDLIYSRDTILHIKDKESLFAQFHKWLKPGGKVFITDYCSGPKQNWSSEFEKYVDQRGYDLRTVDEYGGIFTRLGYKNVKAKDVTDVFVSCLKNELNKMAEIKESFVKEFSLEDFDYLIDGWNAKLVRCAAGDQRWGYFYCEK